MQAERSNLFFLATAATAAALVAGGATASAAIIGATVADASSGNYTLTSVSVTRGAAGTFTYVPHNLIGVRLTDVDAFQLPLLVPNGEPLPAPGERAALLEDGRLDTGVINITTTNGTPDRSVEVTFTSPVVNSAGEDVLLFEIGGDDGVRFWINDNRNEPDSQDLSTTAYSSNLLSGMPFTLYSYANGNDQDINSLEELESPVGFNFNANSSGAVRALGLDLSLLGVAPGGSISSLRFQSLAGVGGRVDPVLIAGLPAVPEPSGVAFSAIAAIFIASRRRRQRS